MKDKTILKYKYPWPNCGYKFEQGVGKFNGVGKHNNVSDQVVCKRCGNGIKTWSGI